jgi:hypothetical protein
MPVDQPFHGAFGHVDGNVQEGADDVRGHVGHLKHTERAQRVGGGPVEGVSAAEEQVVTDRQAGADREITRFQLVQTSPFVLQTFHQIGHLPLRPVRQSGSRDAHGQRQVSAEADQARRRPDVPGDPFGARQPREHGGRLRLAHPADLHMNAVVDQGEGLPAGQQDRAALGHRQQRTDLGQIDDVVEHDEDVPAVEQTAPQGRGLVDVGGNGMRGDSQGSQEPAEHLQGFEPPDTRRRPVQVGVKLPARKAVADQVRGPYGQGGLTRTRRSGEGDDMVGKPAVRRGEQ